MDAILYRCVFVNCKSSDLAYMCQEPHPCKYRQNLLIQFPPAYFWWLSLVTLPKAWWSRSTSRSCVTVTRDVTLYVTLFKFEHFFSRQSVSSRCSVPPFLLFGNGNWWSYTCKNDPIDSGTGLFKSQAPFTPTRSPIFKPTTPKLKATALKKKAPAVTLSLKSYILMC